VSSGGATTFLVILLLTGLAGSLGHCVGMCGPLVILAGARYSRRGIAATPLHLLYHSGRILVYAVFGIVAGFLGQAVGKASAAAKIPGVLSVLAGLAVILAGLSYLGWLPFRSRTLHPGGWWEDTMKLVLKTPGSMGVFVLGMLNGLLPCGLVYEALLIAAASARPFLAGLGMFLFGAATIPTLVVFGVGVQMLSAGIRQKLVWVGGIFVVLVGIGLMLRGVASLGLIPAMVFG
jgi:uncharacterized protein